MENNMPYMCETCQLNKEMNLETVQVRCSGKSWLASWRRMRRRKCKQYKER